MAIAPASGRAEDCLDQVRNVAWSNFRQHWDINQNQQVEIEELAVRLQRFAYEVDRDNNHVIGPDEFWRSVESTQRTAVAEVRSAMRQQRPEKVAQYLRKVAESHPQAKALTAAIHQLDQNQDRRISKTEVTRLVNLAFHSVDQDSDGNLTEAELHRGMNLAAKELGAHIEARVEDFLRHLAAQ